MTPHPVPSRPASEVTGPAFAGRLFPLDPNTYTVHAIHGGDRVWTETNCYVDLWVEVLHARGADPVPAAACAVAADFDGSQWTFLKFRPDDLFDLYGVDVAEMNVWRDPWVHVEENLAAGMLSTIEVDAFHLPDTAGVGYRTAHSKTTVVPHCVDRAAKRIEYFHNAGFYVLEGDDFDALVPPREGTGTADTGWTPPPYVEQIRFLAEGDVSVDAVARVVRRNLRLRPASNPVSALADAVREATTWLPDAGMETFHLWTFAVLRQCGATAELAADLALWLAERGLDTGNAAVDLSAVAQTAKSVQFRMARAARGRAVDVDAQLDEMARAWEAGIDAVALAVSDVARP